MPDPFALKHKFVSHIPDDADTALVQGSEWNDTHSISGVLTGEFGGTGVDNGIKTLTLGGNLVTTGNFSTVFIQQATTSIILPASNSIMAASAPSQTVQIGVGKAYTALQPFLDTLARLTINSNAPTIITPVGIVDCGSQIANWNHVGSNNISIVGIPPITNRTFVGISGVTGVRGAYNVTITLDDASGLIPGYVVCIRNLPQSLPTQGGQIAPVRGGFAYGLSNSAILNVEASVSLASPLEIDFDGSIAGTILPGMIINFLGQIRVLDTVPTPTKATVTIPFVQEGTDEYYMLYAAEAGSITISAGNVTGDSGSDFSRYSPGAICVPADGSNEGAHINSVNVGAKTMVLDRSISSPAGTKFAVFDPVGFYEGSFQITNVVGNNITLLNRAKSEWPPAVRGISGGTLSIFTSVLLGDDGFILNAPKLRISNCAIVGRSRAGKGLFSDGGATTSACSIYLGSETPVINWDTAAYIRNGSSISGQVTHFSGSRVGCDMDHGASADFDTVIFNGNDQYGLLGGTCEFRFSRAHFNCNGIGGRHQIASWGYGDWPSFFGNESTDLILENKSGMQCVGATFLLSGRVGSTSVTGIDCQNGGLGRMDGCAFAGEYGGTNWAGSGTAAAEAGELKVMFFSGTGISLVGIAIGALTQACVISCGNLGVDIRSLGQTDLTGGFISNNSSGGLINNGGRVYAANICVTGNQVFDISTPDGGGGQTTVPNWIGPTNFAETPINKIGPGATWTTDGVGSMSFR